MKKENPAKDFPFFCVSLKIQVGLFAFSPAVPVTQLKTVRNSSKHRFLCIPLVIFYFGLKYSPEKRTSGDLLFR